MFKMVLDLLVFSVSVEFLMCLIYWIFVLKFLNDDDVDVEGCKVVKKNWDVSCFWLKWYILDDFVKGMYFGVKMFLYDDLCI